MGWIGQIFSSSGFMPHGCCYFWNPAVIWLHVISDALITLSYYSIPLTLVYFVRRRKDVAFDWIFLCFAIFIVACGTTHLMEIINVWHPVYWLSGLIKAVTALTSVVTAILLVMLIPQALALPSHQQLQKSNEALQREIQERTLANNRIVALNEQLVSQAAQLESVNKELESFGYSVSHDLRAPLRHIHGYVDLLREETATADAQAQRYMTVIAESANRMGNLIDNLLTFSRMGRMALRLMPTSMLALVNECREELAQDMIGRQIEWKIDPLPTVEVDRELFKQVWLNLLGNAIKYTKKREKAEITIGCRTVGDTYEFSVQDNGAGFDMRYEDKLFGIFQRLHLKDEFEGTGIGLANVRRIISRHDGRTWGKGEVDKGATFFFTLPQAKPDDHVPPETDSPR